MDPEGVCIVGLGARTPIGRSWPASRPSAGGDVGAATAPLLLGLAVAAARRRHATGPPSLITTSADDGLRGAVLVHAERQPGPEFL